MADESSMCPDPEPNDVAAVTTPRHSHQLRVGAGTGPGSPYAVGTPPELASKSSRGRRGHHRYSASRIVATPPRNRHPGTPGTASSRVADDQQLAGGFVAAWSPGPRQRRSRGPGVEDRPAKTVNPGLDRLVANGSIKALPPRRSQPEHHTLKGWNQQLARSYTRFRGIIGLNDRRNPPATSRSRNQVA